MTEMKKIIIAIAVIAAPFFASAQYGGVSTIDKEIFNICASIFTVGLFMIFILAIVKRVMDHRLKNKIVEKGIPENIIASILKTNPKEDININMKWFAILAGLGTGLTIIYYTLPLGIHSLAIMTFCIAASFLAYYVFLKKSEK